MRPGAQTKLRVSFDYSRHCKNRLVHLVVHVNIDHDITGNLIQIPQTLAMTIIQNLIIIHNLISTPIINSSEASLLHRDIPASDYKKDTMVAVLAQVAGSMMMTP